MSEPASIRYNNPGAMWDGKIARKWGSTQHVVLADGQKNHIAIFPSRVAGAAAQFDLWRTSYSGMTLASAIRRWSGNNSAEAYARALAATGVSLDDRVTPELLAGTAGLALLKTQAKWEAGREYPMSDEEWREAQRAVFQKVGSTKKVQKSGTIIASGAATAGAAHHAVASGVPEWIVYTIAAFVLAGLGFWLYHTIKKGCKMTICDKVDGFFSGLYARVKAVFGNSKTIFTNVLGFASMAWVEVGTDLMGFDWDTVFKHEVAVTIGISLSLVNLVLRYVTTGPVQFGIPSKEVPLAPEVQPAPSVTAGSTTEAHQGVQTH